MELEVVGGEAEAGVELVEVAVEGEAEARLPQVQVQVQVQVEKKLAKVKSAVTSPQDCPIQSNL
jgi:hypothetical protein